MNITAKFDDRQFKEAAERIAVFSNKSMLEVCRQQAGLFVSDAVKFTPPFGDAPITEKWPVQREVGEKRVEKDIRKAFMPVERLAIFHSQKPLGNLLRRALRGTKNRFKAEQILREVGIKTDGIIAKANEDFHNLKRNTRGSVRSGKSPFIVTNFKSIDALIRKKQKLVGLSKSGWRAAVEGVNKFRARAIGLPAWVRRHGGTGGYQEGQAGNKSFVEVSNSVNHAQKHADKIMTRAWNNRIRNIQLQAQKQEQAMQRAAKKAGLA